MNLALWSAKTGLDSQNTQMAIIANNLANTNTTGFKADRAAFQDLMYQNIRQVGAQSTQNTEYPTGLTLGTGVRIVATEKDYTQGSINQTTGALDVSVSGVPPMTLMIRENTTTPSWRSRSVVVSRPRRREPTTKSASSSSSGASMTESSDGSFWPSASRVTT